MSSNSQVTTLESQAAKKPAAAAKVVKAAGSGHDVALSGRKVSVTIHANDGIGGSDAVPVGLNGFMYQIPRGEPQEIPEEVLEVLKNAITVHMSNGKGSEVIERPIPRFAYTVHGFVEAEKQAA